MDMSSTQTEADRIMNLTVEELTAEAKAHFDEAAASFDRCDTDGFVSQWASDINGRKMQRQAQIAADGGLATFPALFDLDGNWVPAKRIEGNWGPRWMVLDADGNRTGEYLPYMPARRSTLAKKGYTEGEILAPAYATIGAPKGARGLSGATSCYVATVRRDADHVAPTEIVFVDRFAAD